MAVASTTETPEEKSKRENITLDQAMGLWDRFWSAASSFTGFVFSWGFPALILGGIFLAAAGPISELLPEEWKQPFHAFTGYIKDQINGLTGSEIFTRSQDEIEAMKGAMDADTVRSNLAGMLGGNNDIATAIIPANDTDAAKDFITFLDQETRDYNVGGKKFDITSSAHREALTKDGAQITKMMARFIQEKPDTMLRIVNAMPAGGMAALPAPLKDALKLTLGNQQILASISSAPWVAAAIAKMADGKSDTVKAKLLELAGTKPNDIAPLLGRLIDGNATAEAELSKLVEDNLSPEEITEEVTSEYENAKNGDYGALLTALENADSSFKTEAVTALTQNPDKSQIVETLLPIIILKPERIAALKGLPNEALAPLMVPLNTLSPLMAIPAARDAMLDAVAKLAQTNSAGKNELGDAVIAMSAQTNPLQQGLILSQYINADPARKTALNELKTQLEAMKMRGAQDKATTKPYADFIAQIDAIVKVDTGRAAAASEAVENAPEPVQNYFADFIQNPKEGLQDLLSNEDRRAWLQQPSKTGGPRNSVLLGDALAGLDVSKFPEHAAMLKLLTKKNEHGVYLNLEALLQAADAMDKATGANDTTLIGALAKPEAERSEADNALLRTLLESEQAADAANIKYLSILMALGQTDGIKLVQNQAESVAAGEKKYRLTSNPDVTFSASEVAGYFANDKDGNPNANIVAFAQLAKTLKENNPDNPVLSALAEHFWNDKNDNKKVDTNEGFASVLFNAGNLQTVLAMPANGGKQTPLDDVLTFLAQGLVSFNNPPLLSLMAFKEVVDQQLVPSSTPATGPAIAAVVRS